MLLDHEKPNNCKLQDYLQMWKPVDYPGLPWLPITANLRVKLTRSVQIVIMELQCMLV